MLDPQTMSPGSIMPRYPWLFEEQLDASLTNAKISAMRTLGVPYPDGYEIPVNGGLSPAMVDLNAQTTLIAARLEGDGIEGVSQEEIIALIAYLQRLGTDFTSTSEP